MKLKYIEQPPSEGGAAVPGVGTIHRSEIAQTLQNLSEDLNLPFDLNDYVLGSTGKKEYSGDIDVVIDTKWWTHGVKAFYDNLFLIADKESVARHGDFVHLRYPIADYNQSLQGSLPRTGFVQIDFNFGDSVWERFYHFSPGEHSGYKGAHRNLAISAILAENSVVIDKELDSFGRPLQSSRWKWGSNGIIHVIRSSRLVNKQWVKKQTDHVIDGPFTDPEFIAKIVFDGKGSIPDLQSLESLMIAVQRYFPKPVTENIFKRIAHNFSEWPDGKYFQYPFEIEQYFSRNDK